MNRLSVPLAARRRRGVVVALAGVASLVGGSVGGVARPVAAALAGQVVQERTYRPPVTAPVADPFRPPPEPWLPGNRGLEYATEPGTLVGAIGPGTVTFAGPVAGSLHVTVLHPDGLRSSYSFLAAIRTTVGRQVGGGDVVGVAGGRLHLGVRRGAAYLDPASLWGTRVRGGRVVLVPLDGGDPDAGAPATERAGLPPPAPPTAIVPPLPAGSPPAGVGSRLSLVMAGVRASLTPAAWVPVPGTGP